MCEPLRYLEPILEPVFHADSYGYRPGKSAIDAVRTARERCWRSDWPKARRVGYGLDRTLPTEEKLGLEGTPRLRATGFSQRQSAVRSGFRMRYGPAQVSWPHLRPQRYGGNARAGRPHNPC